MILVRVLPLLQSADQLLHAILSLIGKAHSWIGCIDAQQLILYPLTPFDGTAQHILDFRLSRLAMREEDLHQTGESLVDTVTITRGDFIRQCEQTFVAIREVMAAQ
ncbi:hypothetical protein D9M70_539990 [compost metagenome]